MSTAIRRAGGVSELAKLLRITPSSISQWQRVPLGRVRDVSRVTDVPDYVLRPDFFPNPAHMAGPIRRGR